MKITAMLRQGSDDKKTALRTEPPLTDEILDCAIKSYFGESYRNLLVNEHGVLVVTRVSIPKEQIEQWNNSLTNAEKFVQQKKTRDEKTRGDTLQARAKMMGLPLE